MRLWNYASGICELAREYFVTEDSMVRAQARPLVNVAMHPSGYQLAVSFIDKCQIYHILHDGLRPLKHLEIRNAYLIRYSKGGAYFFLVERQMIYIYNAYTLTEITKFPVDTSRVLNLVVAEFDRAFAVLGVDGYIGRFRLPSGEKINCSVPDASSEWHSFKGIDFVKESREIGLQPSSADEKLLLGVVGQSEDAI